MNSYQDEYQRGSLADKVLYRAKLTPEERRMIYQFLTGEDAPNIKRGAPKTEFRDISLAVDFLSRDRTNVRSIISELGRLHRLPGLETVEESTFYHALDRGITRLEEYTTKWLEFVERDGGDWNQGDIDTAKQHLDLIAEYRKGRNLK